MQAVFLDKNSLDQNDLDFSALTETAENWTFYDSTEKDERSDRIKHAEIIVSNKVVLDKDVLEKAENVKLICVAATGTNNIDIEYAKSRDIRVCNVRAYGTPSVVQHVFTLLLMLMRNIPQYQAAVKRGDWYKSHNFCLLDYPIEDLTGKTLGIVGYGELGQGVGKIADAFGMDVLIASYPGKVTDNKTVPFEQLLSEVDVLTLHCPLTAQTTNLISKNELAKMKPSAYLVNMARGGIVDEEALKNALIKGELAGAAIDVLSEEPPQKSSPLLQLDIPNLIVTPHIAWASRTARQTLLNQVADNIKYFYSGEAQNVVI